MNLSSKFYWKKIVFLNKTNRSGNVIIKLVKTYNKVKINKKLYNNKENKLRL